MVDRIIGVINPTIKPYLQPQISPHNKIGICIGKSILPICGICPVNKGRISPMAINIADKVRFLML